MVREGCCARTKMDAGVSERKERECLPVFCRTLAEEATTVASTDKSSSSPFYLPPLPHFYQFLAANESSR